MNRWGWLLAVPYVVTVSSSPPCGSCGGWGSATHCISQMNCGNDEHLLRISPDDKHPKLACYGRKDDCIWVYDLTEAMNAAHERRIAREDGDD